jgi:hypothetical protein
MNLSLENGTRPAPSDAKRFPPTKLIHAVHMHQLWSLESKSSTCCKATPLIRYCFCGPDPSEGAGDDLTPWSQASLAYTTRFFPEQAGCLGRHHGLSPSFSVPGCRLAPSPSVDLMHLARETRAGKTAALGSLGQRGGGEAHRCNPRAGAENARSYDASLLILFIQAPRGSIKAIISLLVTVKADSSRRAAGCNSSLTLLRFWGSCLGHIV